MFKIRISTNDATNEDLFNVISIVITPEGRHWDTHCDSYANNESEYSDYKGNILYSEYVND